MQIYMPTRTNNTPDIRTRYLPILSVNLKILSMLLTLSAIINITSIIGSVEATENTEGKNTPADEPMDRGISIPKNITILAGQSINDISEPSMNDCRAICLFWLSIRCVGRWMCRNVILSAKINRIPITIKNMPIVISLYSDRKFCRLSSNMLFLNNTTSIAPNMPSVSTLPNAKYV